MNKEIKRKLFVELMQKFGDYLVAANATPLVCDRILKNFAKLLLTEHGFNQKEMYEFSDSFGVDLRDTTTSKL